MNDNDVVKELMRHNHSYASDFGMKSTLTMPPKKQFAILTCMDARLDPAKYAGLKEGDAHVIRNAGGRASQDAIRSLIISHMLLGTKEWFVIHHTDCGMTTFTKDKIRDMFEAEKQKTVVDDIDWLTFSDNQKSVILDVKNIKKHPLVSKNISVYGYIFDVKTGLLKEVQYATEIGKAS